MLSESGLLSGLVLDCDTLEGQDGLVMPSHVIWGGWVAYGMVGMRIEPRMVSVGFSWVFTAKKKKKLGVGRR